MLTAEAGLGETTLMRHLCDQLPVPEHRIVYLCDTASTAASVYRNLASELGLTPSIAATPCGVSSARDTQLFDEHSVVPILVIDEAQHLSDDFFYDLAGFLNFAFDRQDLLTIWLVGLPSLRARLDMGIHSALRTRIVSPNQLRPKTREQLFAMVRHGLAVAGATEKVVADPPSRSCTASAEATLDHRPPSARLADARPRSRSIIRRRSHHPRCLRRARPHAATTRSGPDFTCAPTQVPEVARDKLHGKA